MSKLELAKRESNGEENSSAQMIEGRVAQILNARELVINVGFEGGVVAGMKFAVLSEHPLEVRDPVSGDVLDTLDREKVRVEAVEVRSRITICQTYRTKYVPGGSLYGLGSGFGTLAKAMEPPRHVVETLKAEDASLPPPLPPEQSYVKINDRVIQVEESDE